MEEKPFQRRRINTTKLVMEEEDDPWPGWFPFEPHPLRLKYEEVMKEGASGIASVRRSLEAYGVVVLEGLIPPDVCERAKGDLLGWMKEEAGVDATDPSTYHLYCQDYLNMSPTILGMMNAGSICFSPAVLLPRAHHQVEKFFHAFYDTPDPLVMELGGAFWSFPPETYPGGAIDGDRHGGYWHWDEMW